MSSKITIIGAGSVGATIAYTLSQRSIASEIVLIDINKDKAEGEVMDIEQGTSFREPISIVAGDYPDAAPAGSDEAGHAPYRGHCGLEAAARNYGQRSPAGDSPGKGDPPSVYDFTDGTGNQVSHGGFRGPDPSRRRGAGAAPGKSGASARGKRRWQRTNGTEFNQS